MTWLAALLLFTGVARAADPDIRAEIEDKLVIASRVEKIEGAACAAWSAALRDSALGKPVKVPLVASRDFAVWTPWQDRDREAITECDESPCKVKLDAAEAGALKPLSEKKRLAKYYELVAARAAAYVKTQARRGYEFPGDPVDPWKKLEELGMKGSLARPATVTLYARKHELGGSAGEARPIRQVVDRRVVSDAKETAVWVRDLYTDHYFDSWGEWGQLKCEEGAVTLTLALVLEFDLLKKTDFLTNLMRPKIRDTGKKQATKYLEDWAARVRERVSR